MHNPEYGQLLQDLRTLRLGRIAEVLDAHLQRAVATNMGYTAFLQGLVADALAQKGENGTQRRIHLARLPYVRSLAEFDFAFQPSVPRALVEELATLRFVERKENCIFLGPPGVGKTHLAVGLSVAACRAGMKVLFTTMADLVADLRASRADNRFPERLRVYTRPHVLVVDDVGFMPLTKQEASDFFHVVASRYEKGSVILTSNKSFSDWGQVMGDGAVASAILDRLLHHTAAVLNIRGDSYRLRERRSMLTEEVKNV
jgi:DNA replication protein DnaC